MLIRSLGTRTTLWAMTRETGVLRLRTLVACYIPRFTRELTWRFTVRAASSSMISSSSLAALRMSSRLISLARHISRWTLKETLF